MRYRLVHLSGSLAGRVQEMDAQEAVLGRDPDSADVLFPPGDRSVSRRHALLREENGVLLLRDLDSSTGTFLDGMDVEEAELGAGDVFELGRGGPRLRLEMEEAGTVVGMPRAAVLTDASRAAARDKAGPGGDPGLRIRLRFTGGSRKGDLVELAGSVFRIGRGAGCAVYTPHDPMVSSQHAKVVRLEQGYVLIDLESTNGTFLNGQRVERSPVQDGDVIGLGFGGPTLRVEVLALERGDLVGRTISIPNFAELVGRRASTLPVPVRDITLLDTTFEIGRDPAATVPLDSPIVSRRHARIDRGASGLVLTDLGSSNGTYVGGQRIQEARLSHGDRVVVGPFELVVSWPNLQAPPVLQLLDTRRRTRIDVRDVSVVAAGRALVENVSLAVPPGSLVALIGPSGAGKSTLLRALSGARPATTGEVLLNGRDLYRSFDTLKATIGYVPQDDIVHQQLTVGESLDYTARLRLPADTTFEERDRRISEVLSILELSERRETPIHRLSGGQRKRVSIATELLTEPNVLFLDEPTSGLDPGLEEALMLLLRELSYKGRTVVLVTHTLDNIHLCDAVALLVDGRLAFFGPPADARAQLDIEHMVNLYSRLKERTPEQWVAAFQASDVHAQWVAAPLASIPAPAPDAAPSAPRERTPPGSIRQWGILAGRYATTLLRDARNALLLLAQAPLIAGLIGLSLLYGQGDVAYTKPKNTILFLLALTSVWFGCSNAVRELVKERAIYLRERMVNLGVMPYVTSKVLVLGLLAIAQCVVFLLILDGWFGVPGRFAFLLGGMVLASFVGILLGLALSALSGSADRAMTLLPILLIPQVLFTSPAVQMDMKGPAGIVARAMPTWWAFDLLRRVALEADDSASDDELEARLQAGELVLMTKAHFTAMLQAGYRVFDYRSGIETTWTAELPDRLGERLPARLGRWRPVVVDAMVLAGFGAVLLGATALLQKRHDRQH